MFVYSHEVRYSFTLDGLKNTLQIVGLMGHGQAETRNIDSIS
ncbi:MAG: hypothetical protein BAJATHORv1_50217 [Candidatus Thorarchaeota archaeon]|nr:MAG: hypothetical protein BAJATHORv1_50217 [Candidatus Thorarchaeota archaeon]